MKKRTDSSSDDIGEKVISGTMTKNTIKLSKKRLLKVGLPFLLVICVVIAGVLINNSIKNSEAINVSKIRALVNKNDCSNNAQHSVSREKVNPNQVNSSIVLLSYRGFCLLRTNNYKQANVVFEQLKSYYAMKHDSAGISNINEQIAIDNYSIAHPVKLGSNPKPEVSPAEAAQIQSFYNSRNSK